MWRSEIARSAITENYHRYVWFLAWPLIMLALIGSCAGRSTPNAGPDQTVQDEVTRFGASAILAYITTSPTDVGKLTPIFGEFIKAPANQHAVPLPRLTVSASFASAKPTKDAPEGFWDVSLTAATTDGAVTYLMPVRKSASGYRALQLPGVIPGPAQGPAVAVNAAAPIDVNSDAAVAVTLRDFFTAWMTGKGDLSRVADTKTVPVFATPPFIKVQLMTAYAGSQIPQQPEGELTTGVIVWGTKTQTTQLSYTLKLTASAGRWVVADIAAQPLTREEKGNS